MGSLASVTGIRQSFPLRRIFTKTPAWPQRCQISFALRAAAALALRAAAAHTMGLADAIT
ncbi:hypothetical protein [Streptomyces anulatus]|uniref:hypothetical protein n=1 Tax=Streptomyces anulatus TaxID=1892 RepID=UPI0033C3CA4B